MNIEFSSPVHPICANYYLLLIVTTVGIQFHVINVTEFIYMYTYMFRFSKLDYMYMPPL